MFPGGIRSLQSRNTTKITAARESNRSGRKSLRSGRTTYILAWLVPPPLEIGQLSNLSSKKEILFFSIYIYLFTEEDETQRKREDEEERRVRVFMDITLLYFTPIYSILHISGYVRFLVITYKASKIF